MGKTNRAISRKELKKVRADRRAERLHGAWAWHINNRVNHEQSKLNDIAKEMN